MIIKLAIFAVAIYVLYRLFTNDRHKKSEITEKDRKKKIEAGLMVKCPVCGTYFEKDSGVKVKSGNETLLFCDYSCRSKYLQDNEYETEDIR